MSLAFQRNERRCCSRCGLPLEDPASEERGYGPVCARKNSNLYAKTIPANYPFALSVMLGMDTKDLPQSVAEKFLEVKESLLKHNFRAAEKNRDIETEFTMKGEDLRKIIKTLDWMLSFKMEQKDRSLLVSVVKWLGYSSLAAVLSQEASTSAAPLWFKDGCLYLKGATCKAGFLAMKKIPGIQVPSRRGSREPYIAPVSQIDAFLNAVQDFWPFYTISSPDEKPIGGATLDTLRQEAQQWAEKNPVDESQVAVDHGSSEADRKPMVIIRTSGAWSTVAFPWLRDNTQGMYSLIAKVKSLPYKDRKYNPSAKEWSVHKMHTEELIKMLQELFTVREIKDGRLY